MKKLFEKIRAYFKKIKRLKLYITLGIFLIMGIIIFVQKKKVDKLEDKYNTEVNLNRVLNDSVDYYLNQQNEWVAERLTIQVSLKQLVDNYDRLNASQKKLLEKVTEVEKKNSIIAAALIKTNVVLDSLQGKNAVVDTTEKTVNFTDVTPDYKYDITAKYVLPSHSDIKPTLMFNKFELPNEQFVDFHWNDNKKEGYPVSFSVTNTNQFFKTIDINSYIIPNIDKEILDPTGWQKFTQWTVKNGKIIITVGAGVAIGSAVTYYVVTR